MILAQVLLYVTRLTVSRQKMLILHYISVSARRNKPQIRFSVAEDVCFCVFRVFKLGVQLSAHALHDDRRTAAVKNDCNVAACCDGFNLLDADNIKISVSTCRRKIHICGFNSTESSPPPHTTLTEPYTQFTATLSIFSES